MGAKQGKGAQQEPCTLVVSKLSHDGRGLARHEGQVVFVDGALAGETAQVRFTSSKGSYREAVTLELLERSPERVEPPCPHFSTCGGCSLQHLSSAPQLAFKESVLHERLAHAIGEDSYEKLPVISGEVLGYRRKARLAVRWVGKKNKALIGFREQHSSFITDMDVCPILDSRASTLLPALGALISSLHAKDVIPQVEVAVGDVSPEGSDCALVVRHLQMLSPRDKSALVDFATTHQVDIYLQPKGPETAYRLYPAQGVERLYYALPRYQLSLGFHPLDFTQVNAGINRQMLERALELLQILPHERVLDLFCGLGNFTLPIAKQAAQVVGVEGAAMMVERGKENAIRNGLTNIEFYCADLTEPPEKHPFLREGFHKILLDPPRSGAQEVLPALVKLKPERIVYVSCNPATLARDAGILAGLGYRLSAAGAMDMFPHTSHVEAIALFVPAGKTR
jgi:23S rRNA (uracil1939-C5)-methyltransferase